MNQHDTLIVVSFAVSMFGIVALGAKVVHAEVAHTRKMAKLIAARRNNSQ